MKRLFLTNLNKCKLNWRLEYSSFIALKSAHMTIRGETKKFIFPPNLTLNIRPEGAEKRDRYIMLKGSFDIFTLIDTIKSSSKEVKLEYDPVSHRTHLSIAKGFEINLVHPAFFDVLGIGVQNNAWLPAGGYYGILKDDYQPKHIKSLWLHCNNIDQKFNHLNGEPSDVFQVLPAKDCYYENPVFLQLNSTTDELEFDLRDEKGNAVDVESVIFELLIKEHGSL